MRQKRSKTYRKLLSSYIIHFSFRPPFQLLLDSSFTQSLAALHLSPDEAVKRLADVLQVSQLSKGKVKAGAPEIKPLITQCSMVELYKAEKESDAARLAVQLGKSFERRKCNHREAIPGSECLRDVLGQTNKHRYLLASDDKKLRNGVREDVPGVPMVHTNQSRVIVLEPMSERTRRRVEEVSKHGRVGRRRARASGATEQRGPMCMHRTHCTADMY